MSDVDRLGVERAMRESLAHVAGDRASCTSASTWTLSTPTSLPASARPFAAGCPTARRTWRMELVAESDSRPRSDVVEVNPILDRENATAKLAVELVASALGARIL